MTFTLVGVIIRYTQKEGKTLKAQKKVLRNSKKLLTNYSRYGTIRMYQGKGSQERVQKNFQNFKKVLDKLPNLWYNKYIKTRTVLKTRKELILWKTRR